MFCTKCGQQANDIVKFCSSCGHAFSAPDPSAPPRAEQSESPRLARPNGDAPSAAPATGLWQRFYLLNLAFWCCYLGFLLAFTIIGLPVTWKLFTKAAGYYQRCRGGGPQAAPVKSNFAAVATVVLGLAVIPVVVGVLTKSNTPTPAPQVTSAINTSPPVQTPPPQSQPTESAHPLCNAKLTHPGIHLGERYEPLRVAIEDGKQGVHGVDGRKLVGAWEWHYAGAAGKIVPLKQARSIKGAQWALCREAYDQIRKVWKDSGFPIERAAYVCHLAPVSLGGETSELGLDLALDSDMRVLLAKQLDGQGETQCDLTPSSAQAAAPQPTSKAANPAKNLVQREGEDPAAQRAKKLAKFRDKLEEMGVMPGLISDVRTNQVDDHVINLTIGAAWFSQSRGGRLQAAQAIQKVWAIFNAPINPEASSIKILDMNGGKLGGSGTFEASSISLDDE